LTTPSGATLSWYELGRGRPLALLHGWSASAAFFSELAALLADDYRVLIPDLPGHGESPPELECSLTALSAVLGEWLLATAGDDEPLVAGWSLGGMLALQLAHDGSPAPQKLALLGVTPRFTRSADCSFGLPPGQVRVLARNLERRFETTLAEFFALAFAGEEIAAERLREIRRFAVSGNALPDRDTARALLETLLQQDQREILSGVRQPTLVLHGSEDRIAPLAAGRFLAEALPQARLVELAGVGHAPFLSRPQQVAELLRGFF
jgi:pimeloyl-[acyl-carrier protein] methyl ester esterase